MIRRLILSLCVVFLSANGFSQEVIPYQSYGEQNAPVLVYLHGGPGFNAVTFEQTAAKNLAAAGFRVISYDRRGEGRAADLPAAFTYQETVADLLSVLDRAGVGEVTLLAHSFGGVVATEFAASHPDRTAGIILVSSLIDAQETFLNIRQRCRKIYEDKDDTVNLNYINMLAKMDANSLLYANYCFAHAMQNGFYTVADPSSEARALLTTFKTDTLLLKYAGKLDYTAPMAFWKNEAWTTVDLRPAFAALRGGNDIPIRAIYGREDGLFSAGQVNGLTEILGAENVVFLGGASHNPFIDRQEKFIRLIREWL